MMGYSIVNNLINRKLLSNVDHLTYNISFLSSIDGQEVLRHDWMFKLVGTETFKVGKSSATCVIKIDPVGGFAYQYSLMVNGKPYKTFVEQQNKVPMKCSTQY